MDRHIHNIMFYERCRLCLDEKGYCDIFEKNNLKEDILDCLGIKIALLDHLPQKICEKCLNIVNKVSELRQIARKNDKQLKLLFYDGRMGKETQYKIVNSEQCNVASTQPHLAIQTFLTVRKDLFETSVPGDLSDDDMTELDSSQDYNRNVDNDDNEEKVEYKCDKCFKIFDKRKKLYHHSRLHNKKFVCTVEECEKKFASKGDLEKHIRTHTGEKPYKCEQCLKRFTQKVTLKSHLETVHSS